MEIKLQKRKAEKNKIRKRKENLPFWETSLSIPFLFRRFPFLASRPTRQRGPPVSRPARPSLSLLLADSPVPRVSSFFLPRPLSSAEQNRFGLPESRPPEPLETSRTALRLFSPLLSLVSQETEPGMDRNREFYLQPNPVGFGILSPNWSRF